MSTPNVPEYQELCDLLEAQVDRYNLRTVLEALANVCDAKADHVKANGSGDWLLSWPMDRAWLLAETWENAAAEIERAAGDGDVGRVSL